MSKDKKGLVYKSTGSWYVLQEANGTIWKARIRGKLKIDENIAATNPVAVGDWVDFFVEDEATGLGIITDIQTRKNYIVRVSPHNRHHKHVVAANIDRAVLIASLAEPRTSNGFIDRFLITAEAYHVPTLIVINKQDLHTEKHRQQLADWTYMYGDAGYELLAVSSLRSETIDSLRQKIGKGTVLFSGHSGVGKSTLINALIPDSNICTMEVSDWSGKGQHTTTFAEMYDQPSGGKIIDTPGVKEFGLIDMKREELSHYFPEMNRLLPGCKFNNCIHLNEPQCAVKAALRAGSLHAERYNSYLSILDSLAGAK